MTDSLLQKVEEKVMALVTELENLRKELHHARSDLNHTRAENSTLKSEKINYIEKMQDLVSLLDAVDEAPTAPSNEYAGRMEVVAAG